MTRSPNADERAAAAWAMGEARLTAARPRAALTELLADPVLAVRRAAVRAAGRIGDLAGVVAALEDRAVAPAAVEALAALEDRRVHGLRDLLTGASSRALARAASALGAGDGPDGDRLLVELLRHRDAGVRYRSARALAARRASPPKRVVDEVLTSELATGGQLAAIAAALGDADDLLAGEVRARLQQVTRRVLALLALVADPRAMRVAENAFRGGAARQVASALELLEGSLPRRLADRVVPFLERRVRLDAVADPLRAILDLNDRHLRRCSLGRYAERLRAEFPEVWKEDSPMLPVVERIHFLRRVPLFRDLSGEDLRTLAEIAGGVELRAGQTLFRKGEAGDTMYVVARGRVALSDGGERLAEVGRTEFFGELAVLDGEPRSADATCSEDAELVSLSRPDLDELIERRPAIAREIIRILTRRLRTTNMMAVAVPDEDPTEA